MQAQVPSRILYIYAPVYSLLWVSSHPVWYQNFHLQCEYCFYELFWLATCRVLYLCSAVYCKFKCYGGTVFPVTRSPSLWRPILSPQLTASYFI
ncbi:hypothetical protein HOY80DRAFT_942035 [Tuber brumale]|nr:hypothetical protein HOY80DRAFT_942035 [Tuber brumale]